MFNISRNHASTHDRYAFSLVQEKHLDLFPSESLALMLPPPLSEQKTGRISITDLIQISCKFRKSSYLTF